MPKALPTEEKESNSKRPQTSNTTQNQYGQRENLPDVKKLIRDDAKH